METGNWKLFRMPTITRITPQKSKKRVNIYIDGQFSFGLDLENLLRYSLKIGGELTQEQLEEIVKKAEFSKTFDKILRFAMMRPRSEKEFKVWLRKYKIHESIHTELFEKLKQLELLDDEKFAKWWVQQRTEFKPRSKSALTFELMQKGIARELIKDVLADTEIDEVALALEITKKKKRLWENKDPEYAKKKIMAFLASRGFRYDVIKKVIQSILKEETEEW